MKDAWKTPSEALKIQGIFPGDIIDGPQCMLNCKFQACKSIFLYINIKKTIISWDFP